MSRKGIEDGRAAFAYKKAEEGRDKEKGAKPSEYKAYCDKIPMMIKTNGLGNTLAFIKSNKNKTYKLIYQQISEWFRDNDRKHIMDFKNKPDLVYEVIKLDSKKYRMATVETLALFNWLRRFARGLIEGGEYEK